MAGNTSQPQPMKPGILSEIKPAAIGAVITDSGLVGEFFMVDGYRAHTMPDSVVNDETKEQIDFPQMGRIH